MKKLCIYRLQHSSKSFQMERIAKNIREIMKNQEIILHSEDILEEMKEMVINLHKLAESNSLAKEREVITHKMNVLRWEIK